MTGSKEVPQEARGQGRAGMLCFIYNSQSRESRPHGIPGATWQAEIMSHTDNVIWDGSSFC